MINFRNITFFVSNISDVSEVLPLSAWLVFGKKQLPYSILGVFFIFSSVIIISTLVTAELGIHNMPAYHILAVLEIVAIYCFYCRLVYHKIFKRGIVLLIAINAGTLFFQGPRAFNSLAWTFDSMIMIGIGLGYFFVLYNEEGNYTPLQKRPDFIITTGWLFYAAGSLFVFIMGAKILSGYADGLFKNAWFFETVSNISKNLIISYGFWLTSKK